MKEENEGSLVDPVTKRPGFTFWLIWVFGSGAAFTILLLVGFPLSTAILGLLGYRGSAIDDGGPFMFYLTFSFALGGLGIGLVQWLLIRKRLKISGWWMVSWIIGMSLVSVISILLEDVTSQAISELVHNAIAGLVVGFIHYLILRRRRQWAASWFVAIVASFVAAGATAFALSLFIEDFEGASFATLVGMAISGFIMMRYLRSDMPEIAS